MNRLLFAAGLLILLTGWSFFAGIRLSAIQVEKQNNDIVLSWQVSLEEGVSFYEVQRRSRFSNGHFVVVAKIPSHGVGKPYQFRDSQVYKTTSEQVDYRIEVVYEDGVREALPVQSIDYAPTAVRRTWGSIKAMFQ